MDEKKDFYYRLSLGLGPEYEEVDEQVIHDLEKLWDDLLWDKSPQDFFYCAHLMTLDNADDYFRWFDRLFISINAGVHQMIKAYFEGVPVEDIVA